MADIQIKIKNLPQIKAAFSRSPALMSKNLGIAIKKTVLYIGGVSDSKVPVRTGRLKSSRRNTWSPMKGTIEYTAKYGIWVHEGTSPYIIQARPGSALFWKGADHPVKRVNHPGIRANPFLRKAVDQSQETVDKLFTKAVQDTLDQIAKETQ